jgi:hypothetical protein
LCDIFDVALFVKPFSKELSMIGSMRKKNRKEWFDRIARQAYSLPADSIGLEFALRKDGASQEEIRYELRSRNVKFAIRSNTNAADTLFVYPFKPEQPAETAQPEQVNLHAQKYLEACAMLGIEPEQPTETAQPEQVNLHVLKVVSAAQAVLDTANSR